MYDILKILAVFHSLLVLSVVADRVRHSEHLASGHGRVVVDLRVHEQGVFIFQRRVLHCVVETAQVDDFVYLNIARFLRLKMLRQLRIVI